MPQQKRKFPIKQDHLKTPQISACHTTTEGNTHLVRVVIENPALIELREGSLVPYTMLVPKDARLLAKKILAAAEECEKAED